MCTSRLGWLFFVRFAHYGACFLCGFFVAHLLYQNIADFCAPPLLCPLRVSAWATTTTRYAERGGLSGYYFPLLIASCALLALLMRRVRRYEICFSDLWWCRRATPGSARTSAQH